MTNSRDNGRTAGRDIRRGRDVSALTFVLLAEADHVDEVTIAENAELFPVWDEEFTGRKSTIVVDDGVVYKAKDAITKGDNSKPSEDPERWERIADIDEEYPAWAQPVGRLDGYPKGAKVTHNKKRWVSDEDGNTHEPGITGWTEVR